MQSRTRARRPHTKGHLPPCNDVPEEEPPQPTYDVTLHSLEHDAELLPDGIDTTITISRSGALNAAREAIREHIRSTLGKGSIVILEKDEGDNSYIYRVRHHTPSQSIIRVPMNLIARVQATVQEREPNG